MPLGHRAADGVAMTSLIASQSLSTSTHTSVPGRPSRRRRAALVGAGVLACALPVVFTVNITRTLLTGELSDHRFHQLTGQGELLCALWLVPLLLLLRAGWRGARPSTSAGWAHVAFAAAGAACAVAAPGGGAPVLVGVILVTGALLWAALPVRPALRGPVRIDPLLAPIALAGSALLLPYAVDQLIAQNAVTSGLHLGNPHFFDQAWISVTMSALAVIAALLPAARGLGLGFALSMVVLGGAGLALGESGAWSGAVLAVGLAAGAATTVALRRTPRN
jgi:hypothetical protein